MFYLLVKKGLLLLIPKLQYSTVLYLQSNHGNVLITRNEKQVSPGLQAMLGSETTSTQSCSFT
jgi:hypothetical protein